MRVSYISKFNILFAEGFSTTQWKNLTVYPLINGLDFIKIQMCLGILNNTSGFASARFESFHKFIFSLEKTSSGF